MNRQWSMRMIVLMLVAFTDVRCNSPKAVQQDPTEIQQANTKRTGNDTEQPNGYVAGAGYDTDGEVTVDGITIPLPIGMFAVRVSEVYIVQVDDPTAGLPLHEALGAAGAKAIKIIVRDENGDTLTDAQILKPFVVTVTGVPRAETQDDNTLIARVTSEAQPDLQIEAPDLVVENAGVTSTFTLSVDGRASFVVVIYARTILEHVVFPTSLTYLGDDYENFDQHCRDAVPGSFALTGTAPNTRFGNNGIQSGETLANARGEILGTVNNFISMSIAKYLKFNEWGAELSNCDVWTFQSTNCATNSTATYGDCSSLTNFMFGGPEKACATVSLSIYCVSPYTP